MKGKGKVCVEFALVFTAYNLRRSKSTVGVKALVKRLEGLIVSQNVVSVLFLAGGSISGRHMAVFPVLALAYWPLLWRHEGKAGIKSVEIKGYSYLPTGADKIFYQKIIK